MSSQTPKYLFLFTHKYPFGIMEIFVGQALEVLSKQYDRIVVLPLSDEGTDTCRELPKNAVLDRMLMDAPLRVNKGYLLRHLGLVLRILTLEYAKTRNSYIIKDLKILWRKFC